MFTDAFSSDANTLLCWSAIPAQKTQAAVSIAAHTKSATETRLTFMTLDAGIGMVSSTGMARVGAGGSIAESGAGKPSKRARALSSPSFGENSHRPIVRAAFACRGVRIPSFFMRL
jgi:hypothetical protein